MNVILHIMWMTIRILLGTLVRLKLKLDSLQLNATLGTNREKRTNCFNIYFINLGQALSSELQGNNNDYWSPINVLS